jgi:hypothetical protein
VEEIEGAVYDDSVKAPSNVEEVEDVYIVDDTALANVEGYE